MVNGEVFEEAEQGEGDLLVLFVILRRKPILSSLFGVVLVF